MKTPTLKASRSLLLAAFVGSALVLSGCASNLSGSSYSRADARAVARYFEFYAGAVDKLHGQTIPYNPGYTVLTVREPHGVTGHIIPWNYPLQIFGRSVGAALAAGNACVVKPAEDACLSLLRVAEIAAEAGLPEGALNIITGYGHEAGAALARHPGIQHISFTGSPQTGKLVSHFGKRERESEGECFGGCCNPMNCRIGAGGEIYTAESEGVVKKFNAQGEFVALIGTVKLSGGCKNVAVAASPKGDRVYFCDLPGSRIIVLAQKTATAAGSN